MRVKSRTAGSPRPLTAQTGSEAPERGECLCTWAIMETFIKKWELGLAVSLQLLAMRELWVVLHNFRQSEVNEGARWEVTSQETKELQRQLLPLMRKRDELWNPRSSRCRLRSTQGLGCSQSCWQVGWQASAADFLKSKSARFLILSLRKVPFLFFKISLKVLVSFLAAVSAKI